MNFEDRKYYSYKSELAILSVLTLIFGFSCLFLGYLILPVAAGFYAALLSYEKKDSRVLSYVIPIVPLVVNVFVNGFYSLEAISYVIIGAIIYVGFSKQKNKATIVFIATTVLLLLMGISLALFAFDRMGTFRISALADFYIDLYESGKTKFIDFLTSFTSIDDNGFTFHNFNAAEAVEMYNSLVFSLIPLSVIFALILVALSTKLFVSRSLKYNSEDDVQLISWKFVTSPFIAYSYIIITAFASLSSQGIVGVSLSFVSSILMAVYFYIGISAMYSFISSKKGQGFAIMVIALTLIVFSSFAPQIVSFAGVFVNNALYKVLNADKTDI